MIPSKFLAALQRFDFLFIHPFCIVAQQYIQTVRFPKRWACSVSRNDCISVIAVPQNFLFLYPLFSVVMGINGEHAANMIAHGIYCVFEIFRNSHRSFPAALPRRCVPIIFSIVFRDGNGRKRWHYNLYASVVEAIPYHSSNHSFSQFRLFLSSI